MNRSIFIISIVIIFGCKSTSEDKDISHIKTIISSDIPDEVIRLCLAFKERKGEERMTLGSQLDFKLPKVQVVDIDHKGEDLKIQNMHKANKNKKGLSKPSCIFYKKDLILLLGKPDYIRKGSFVYSLGKIEKEKEIKYIELVIMFMEFDYVVNSLVTMNIVSKKPREL